MALRNGISLERIPLFPLANRAEPVRWGKDGICISVCQQNVFYSIFGQIRTFIEPVQGPCTMNVRHDPVHDMACVVKRNLPPVRRWRLCEFPHRVTYQIREYIWLCGGGQCLVTMSHNVSPSSYDSWLMMPPLLVLFVTHEVLLIRDS